MLSKYERVEKVYRELTSLVIQYNIPIYSGRINFECKQMYLKNGVPIKGT